MIDKELATAVTNLTCAVGLMDCMLRNVERGGVVSERDTTLLDLRLKAAVQAIERICVVDQSEDGTEITVEMREEPND